MNRRINFKTLKIDPALGNLHIPHSILTNEPHRARNHPRPA